MINKKLMLCFIIGILLVSTFVMAKSVNQVDKLDWKTEKKLVKEDGVYDAVSKNLIKEKDKAEIWIDKKVKNSYHVDSLIEEDTLVDIELFYDIQPDSIEYVSHNGKYKQTYTYNDWTWTDKEDCPTEEYCGGYVTINDVTLEYATGSNTFTDAISGATWMTDGVGVSLTEDTDYTIDGTTFTLINADYAWNTMSITYSYRELSTASNRMALNFTEGIDNVSSKLPTILLIGVVVLLFGVISLLWISVRSSNLIGTQGGDGSL